MKIERNDTRDDGYHNVYLDAGELTVRTGKKLPFGAMIGSFWRVGAKVKLDVKVPDLRGTGITATQYRESAKLMLELAAMKAYGL